MGNNEHFGMVPTIRMGAQGRQDGCWEQEHSAEGKSCEWHGAPAEAARPQSALMLVNADSQTETHVYYDSCESEKAVCVSSECRDEENLGRVLDVTMTLRNVCPGRRSAVGVHLVEMDENGSEYARGFRSLTVPAHNASCNRDVELPSMRFILPEDVSMAGRASRRHFVVRTTNHYLDDAITGCGCNS